MPPSHPHPFWGSPSLPPHPDKYPKISGELGPSGHTMVLETGERKKVWTRLTSVWERTGWCWIVRKSRCQDQTQKGVSISYPAML